MNTYNVENDKHFMNVLQDLEKKNEQLQKNSLNIDQIADYIKEKTNVPYIELKEVTYSSNLCKDIYITISLDKKEDWQRNVMNQRIINYSRYVVFHYNTYYNKLSIYRQSTEKRFKLSKKFKQQHVMLLSYKLVNICREIADIISDYILSVQN